MSFFADRKMMGIRRPSARMREQRSNPFMPGNMTSNSSRSGFSMASRAMTAFGVTRAAESVPALHEQPLDGFVQVLLVVYQHDLVH